VKSTQTAAYKRFREKLKAARIERGWTQVEAAAAFGTYDTMISRMETGERRVDIIEAAKFARIYRKPLSYFVDE
jgi:transcriptional regulator with XRE-family HTH domain